MINKRIKLLMFVLAIALCFLVGCKPKPISIEVSTNPTKLVYFEGETFDSTGMVVKLLYDDNSSCVLSSSDYQISNQDPLSLSDKEITISYLDFNTTVSITVRKKTVLVTDVEVRQVENTTYMRTMPVAPYIEYREVYSNNTYGEWSACIDDDITSKEIINNKLKVMLSFVIQNKTFSKEISLDLDESVISVSQLLQTSVDDSIQMVNGYLVGIASTNSQVEYLLMDKSTSEIIGVTGLEGEGSFNDYSMDTNGLQVGDELCIPVKLVNSTADSSSSNFEKINCSYQGGEDILMAVKSKNNDISLDHENAVTISNQDELIAFLSNENRADNFYKVVKLHGKLNYIYYESSKQYRFFFDGVSNYEQQKIEGISPCFSSATTFYSTSSTLGKLLFNQDGYAPTDWNNPASLVKDVYAVFIGGNKFYHAFAIISSSDVVEVDPVFVDYSFRSPNKLTYKVNDVLDLSGAAILKNFDYGSPEEIAVTTNMLDSSVDMTTAGTKVVSGKYNDFIFSFEVEVIDKEVMSISLSSELVSSDYNYRLGSSKVISDLCDLKLSVTYDNGQNAEIDINENMITSDEWKEGTVNFSINYLEKTIVVPITVKMELTDVSQIKSHVGSDEYYDLTGIIIGQTFISGTVASPANGEVLVKDVNTDDVIGVRGIISPSSLLVNNNLSVGDKVIIQVKVNQYMANSGHSEYKKIYATKSSDSEIIVISHENNTLLNLDNAVDVLCQDDINKFLLNADTRSENAYKLIKLGAGATIANYSLDVDSSYITFTGTSVATSKVDGLAPFLHQMNEEINLGEKTYLELLFGEEASRNVNFGEENGGNVLKKDVYLMYVGGQGAYYHQFILLGEEYISESASRNLKEIVFTQPTKLAYNVNDPLDLAGGKIEYQYYYSKHNYEVSLTEVIQSYDMSVIGKQTISFVLPEKTFTYEIMINEQKPVALEVVTMPTISEYSLHTTIEDIDLTGGEVKVIYSDSQYIIVPMETLSLLKTSEPLNGDVTLQLTNGDLTCDITLSFKALTIPEFLTKEVGEFYDIKGVVVGPVSSHAAIELLLKDKESNSLIGVYNTGACGTTGDPKLDTSVINVGDEICITVKLTEVTAEGVNKGKLYANAVSKDEFANSLMILSKNNSVNIDLGTATSTIIDSQEGLINFLNDSNRFYKIVKISGVKAITYTSNSGPSFYRIFFGDSVTTLSEQKVNSSSPVFSHVMANYYLTNDITTYFTNNASNSYADPSIATHDFYAVFVGGNKYYHAFIPLGDEWVVEKN